MFTTKNLLMLTGRHMIIAILAIGAAVLAAVFLSQQITRLSDDVLKNRKLASALEKRTELFAAVKRDTELVGTNDVLIEQAFIPSSNILDFVATLESLALKNGITQAFHFDTPTPSPISAPFPLAMVVYSNSLNGNLKGFSNYLKDFERLPYFTKIESLSISSSGKTNWRDTGIMSFRASVQTNATQ
jgi:Tfp pilus assembly protein PilO